MVPMFYWPFLEIVDAFWVSLNDTFERSLTFATQSFFLSKLQVLFVCTANVVENIPNPLLDRMEVISIAGYITDEKMHIARDYLEKATREACGIKPEQVFLMFSIFLSFEYFTCKINMKLLVFIQTISGWSYWCCSSCFSRKLLPRSRCSESSKADWEDLP